MSKTKFTKGTWTWNRFWERGDKSSKLLTSTPSKSSLSEPIAIIPHDDVCEEGEEEIRANAALIAAAPDMYAALEVFVRWWDEEEKGPQYSSPDKREGPNGEAEWRAWWSAQLDLVAQAHLLGPDALAKARGEIL